MLDDERVAVLEKELIIINNKFKSPRNNSHNNKIYNENSINSPIHHPGSIGKQSFTQRFDFILETLQEKALGYGLVTEREL